MDTRKIDRLKKYAKDNNFLVDESETLRLRNLICDTSITIRIPTDLKEQLQRIADRQGIPYQRLIKSILIDSLKKEA